jgi:hypothetical protein
MSEYELLKLWNQKRLQIVAAQIGPAAVLAVVTVLAVQGKFMDASTTAKALAIAVTGVTGLLAIITQYAIIRESESLVQDLAKVKDSSALSKKIAGSRDFLSLTAIAVTGFGILNFSFVLWSVLSK